MEELKEIVESYLSSEVSCLLCGGEMCNCDGGHDKEKREKMAVELIKLINPEIASKPNLDQADDDMDDNSDEVETEDINATE